MAWNPQQYLGYADERGRPFFDLLSRVRAPQPRLIVDLGCGPGNLTVTLKDRWPDARVMGVDSSAEMITAAAQLPGVEWERGDLRTWQPPKPVDVIVSNAALQWAPGYADLMPHWVDQLAPGGWLAIQVPNHHDEPAHLRLEALMAEPEFADLLNGIERIRVVPGIELAPRLLDLGCAVDVWDTDYHHLLPGDQAVFRWMAATGARPALDRLTGQTRQRFAERYAEALSEAYPATEHGTWFRFPRSFLVAHKPA